MSSHGATTQSPPRVSDQTVGSSADARRWERIAAGLGVVFVALQTAAGAMLGGAPSIDASPSGTNTVAARGGPRSRHSGPVSLLALGAVCGLAWAAGFRGMMSEIAGEDSDVDWVLTFVWLLLPGIVVGALLGWAEHIRRTGGRRRRRWLALSPLVFAGVLLSAPTDPGGLFQDGVGGGAIAVPLFGMAGGLALSGRGPRPARFIAGLAALAPIPLWAFTATSVGGAGLALSTARGAWVALYFWAFLALLALACAIPHRPVR